MNVVRLVHLSDLHFGAKVDLDQIVALERLIPGLQPHAIVLSGDLTQRARHGEFQRALAFAEQLRRTAPVLAVAGNHDTTWWRSPFGVLGDGAKHAKYRRYFGDPRSALTIPGAVLVGALSSHGLAFGSMTWNLRDLTVKGHLPGAEVDRAAARFREAGDALRVVVLHHNVRRGQLSQRMGLARWKQAQRRLAACGADLVLCGHDHQESVGQLEGGVVVAASGTHTSMSRGGRPTVFNLVEADGDAIRVRFLQWERTRGTFEPAGEARFARTPRAGQAPVVPPPAAPVQTR